MLGVKQAEGVFAADDNMVVKIDAQGFKGRDYLLGRVHILGGGAGVPRRVVMAEKDARRAMAQGALHHKPGIHGHFRGRAAADPVRMQHLVGVVEGNHP